MFSRPLERALAPGVIVTHYQDADEYKHLEQRKFRERKVVAHEDDCPWQQKDRFDVENQKQHRDDVVAHSETLVCFGRGIDAALVWPHLALFVLNWPQETSQDDRQDGKDHSHTEKDHDRPISCDGAADGFCCRGCCLKEHQFA